MRPHSKAAELGVQIGDIIVATSATAGSQLWTHDTLEGVKSALSTRFVMSSTVRIRFRRLISTIDPALLSQLFLPKYLTARLKRPVGIHVVSGAQQLLQSERVHIPNLQPTGVYVQSIKSNLGAARNRRLKVGDQIVALSATWGDRLWEVNSVDSFILSVQMRPPNTFFTVQVKRWVPLLECIQNAGDCVDMTNNLPSRLFASSESTSAQRATLSTIQQKQQPDSNSMIRNGSMSLLAAAPVVNGKNGISLLERLNRIKTPHELNQLIEKSMHVHLNMHNEYRISAFTANKMMSKALQMGCEQEAVVLFEKLFGYSYPQNNTTDMLESSNMTCLTSAAHNILPVNNYVATTAVKAYGRLNKFDKAAAVLPWMEAQGATADIYFMSAILYVCAKSKRTALAERIFWQDIPGRNLTYTVATVNSLMYMYARMHKAEDALKLHDLIRTLGLKCDVFTYGVLIKVSCTTV